MRETRKIRIKVTPMTLHNLHRLAKMAGNEEIGRVVDKLVRDRMVAMRGSDDERL